MPWSLNRLTEEVETLKRSLPLTFNWYTGRTQPPVEQQQIVFWEDVDNEIAKILMRRGSKTYVFTSYLTPPGAPPPTITVDNHAHRHATSGSTKPDTGLDPIGPYNFTWQGTHAWTPNSNSVPVTINKTSSLTSANLVKILDTDGSFLFDIDNNGLVGINATPDALLTIGAGGLAPPITSGLVGWYHADTITAAQVVGGVLSTGALVSAWTDSSGNGNHLTGHGCTLVDVDTPGFRPKWNAAGTSKAIPNLPSVSFEGDTLSGFGAASYFTIDTGTLGFTAGAGWTICFIMRDHDSTITNASTYLGVNVPVNGEDVDDNYRATRGSNLSNWIIQQGGGDQNFSALYSHTNGNDTEAIVLRVNTAANGNTLRCWLDGVLQTAAGGTRTVDPYTIRYIGRHLSAAGNVSTVYGKSLCEILIFNRALSDTEVATVNTYLLNRIAGSVSSTTYDLTRWESNLGAVLSRIDTTGQFGFGVAPTVPLHVNFAGTQAKLGYDASNYVTIAAGATGIVTFDAVGSGHAFSFLDPLSVTGSITASTTIFGTNIVGATNRIAKWTNGATGTFGSSLITDDGTSVTVTTPANATVGGAVVTINGGAAGGNFLAQAGAGIGAGSPGIVLLSSGDGPATDGGTFYIITGGGTGGNGGLFSLTTGDGNGGFAGGAVAVTTGVGNTGGDFNVTLGTGVAVGGTFNFKAGDSGAAVGKYKFYKPSGALFAGDLNFNALTADRTYTFPDASGTVAFTSGFPVGASPTGTGVDVTVVNGSAVTFMRSDAAPKINQGMVPTWTGIHTFSAKDIHNAGIDFGTSGRLDSHVVDGAGVVSFLLQPSVALTTGTDRFVHKLTDSTNTYGLRMNADFSWAFLGNTGSNLANTVYLDMSATIGNAIGINFAPSSINASSGASVMGKAASIVGGLFTATPAANASPTGYVIGGAFATRSASVSSGNVPLGFLAGLFRAGDSFNANSGKTFAELGGWRVTGSQALKNAGTFTSVYGGYIENQVAPASGQVFTDLSGLIIEEMTKGGTTNNGIRLLNATAGYKAITIRDQNTAAGSSAAGTWDFFCTVALQTNSDFKLTTAGNGIYVKEGTNATSGVATLVLGTVTVNTTKVTANSRIYLTVQVLGTVAVPTPIAVTARTAGTSFVITSASATDTSTVAWVIIEPS